jgi:hypothetical protein
MRVRLPPPAPVHLAVVAQRSELEAAKLETGVRLPLTAPRGRSVLARGVAPACAPLCKSDRPGFDPRAPHSRSLSRAWPRGRAAGLHPADAGSTPAVRSVTHHEPDLWRGTWSAKPRFRVRFPAGSPGGGAPLPPFSSFSSFALDAERRGGRLLNGTVRVRLPPRALFNLQFHFSGRGSAWQERLSGGQEIAGSNPAAPTVTYAFVPIC